VRVINLATNSEGAYAFKYNLRTYDDLDYDLAILYTGYNDLSVGNTYVFRHTSPIFRLTGYLPIFPLIFGEKAMALRNGGDVEAAYRGERTVFKPNLAQQATAGALEAAVGISQSLEQQLGTLTRKPSEEEFQRVATGCRDPWTFYCEHLHLSVDWVLDRGKRVIVVTQPYFSDGHVEQQAAMVGMLRAQFPGEPRLRHVNLGLVVDLKDRALAYDGMHLSAVGNERIAEHLVQPVSEMLQQ
jgi:hypothetical protein